ncbi:MAG: TonB family protein [Pseudomonadota bacterium]|nr:TonB family protein [Pseudomonadota bacterium]
MANLNLNFSGRRLLLIAITALSANLILFVLLPRLMKHNHDRSDLLTMIPAVNLVRIPTLKPKIPPREKPPEPPKEKPKIIPPKAHRPPVPNKKQLTLEPLPRLNFAVNPKLMSGITVDPPPPTTAPIRGSYEQGEIDQQPLAIFKLKPPYPFQARRLNISGSVRVKFLVDNQGRVSDITILKSNPRGMFDKSVLKTLPSWKFTPGTVKGNKVATWVVTTIEFNLH